MAKEKKRHIKCDECRKPSSCCKSGAWLDLEEAKKILELKIKGGDFFHMEKDDCYPSGYGTSTSIGYARCTFLTRDGLCAIHKIDYSFKPSHCKEFPYEKGKLSPLTRELCAMVRPKRAKHKKNR